MQTATATLIAALARNTVLWAKRVIKTDWALNGYDGDGTIDDLSDQVGKGIVVKQSLDDGMPNELTIAGVGGVPDATIPMAYGQSGLTAAQYFSPFRTDSPIIAYDRDVAPITIDAGAIGTSGPERLRVFTGQMMNVPVSGKTATIEAVSATRMKMSTLMQPPAVMGHWEGLETTWPVVFALHKCGLYASPPPRTGCRLWMPGCGSIHPMIPEYNPPQLKYDLSDIGRDGYALSHPIDQVLEMIDGPYTRGTHCWIRDDAVRGVGNMSTGGNTWLETGTDLFSQAANKGRLELYVRGDATSYNYPGVIPAGPPGTPPSVNWGLFRFYIGDLGGSSVYVDCGIASNRFLYVTVYDGAHGTHAVPTTYVTSAAALPTDSAWHFVGFSWDIAGNRLAVRLDNTTTVANPVMTTVNLPVTEAGNLGSSNKLRIYIPFAEFQITSGANADSSLVPWINEAGYVWTNSARIVTSNINLRALAERTPSEAWTYIASLAQGELAAMGLDENDLFKYFGQRYWAQDAQQTAVDVLSTTTNVGDLEVSLDYTRIRNSVKVSYTDTLIGESFSHVYKQTGLIEIPAKGAHLGVSAAVVTLRLTPQDVLVQIRDFTITTHDGTGTEPTDTSFITANSASDGSGSYATPSDVTAVVTSWTPGEIVVTITNNTVQTWYLANDLSWSVLAIAGSAVKQNTASITTEDAASIVDRNRRTLDMNLPQVQSRDTAGHIGQFIVDQYAKAVPRIMGATVFGDPRRQPGDLITFADAANTGASGNWREISVEHRMSGPSYTQKVNLVKAYQTFNWLSDVFVAAGSGSAGDNAPVNPGVPTGVAVNDLVLILASIRNSGTGTVDTPAGWTSLIEFGNVKLLGRIWQPGDVMPSVTFSNGVANATTLGRSYALRGMSTDLSTIVHNSATQLNGSAQNIAYPALTVTERDCVVLYFGWKQDEWTSVATLAGATQMFESQSATGDDAGEVMHGLLEGDATNISAGSFVVTGGVAAISRGVTIALHTSSTTDTGGTWDGDSIWADDI